MKKIKLNNIIFIISLLTINSFASKDYYMIERYNFQNKFVQSCTEKYIGTEVEIPIEGYCKCVFEGVSIQFKNSELLEVDNQKEPIFSEFMHKIKNKMPQCKKRYILPVSKQIQELNKKK